MKRFSQFIEEKVDACCEACNEQLEITEAEY